MFRFENYVIAMQAVLWMEWDEKHPDKHIALHFVSGTEPLVFSGPQAARLHKQLDEMFPDMLAAERNAKLPQGFVVQRSPLKPPSVG